jgi:phage baseplate assembly protein W
MAGLSKIQDIPSNVVYSDLNIDVGTSTAYDMLYNELAVAKRLEALWSTPKKSRVFRRSLGSGLNSILFDPMNRVSAMRIEQEFARQVAYWESDVSNFQSQAIPDYDNQQYYVTVTYQIPALGKDSTYSFNVPYLG